MSEEAIRNQVGAAILITQGQDRVIVAIDEGICCYPGLPKGTRFFVVESKHHIERIRPCLHIDHVYVWNSNIVVINLKDMMSGANATIAKRLTSCATSN